MPNDSLNESLQAINELIAGDAVPAVLSGEITLVDLVELVQKVTTEEVKAAAFDDVPEEETEEVLLSTMERIALKVALVCLHQQASEEPEVVLPIDGEVLMSLFAQIMRAGGTTVKITVS